MLLALKGFPALDAAVLIGRHSDGLLMGFEFRQAKDTTRACPQHIEPPISRRAMVAATPFSRLLTHGISVWCTNALIELAF